MPSMEDILNSLLEAEGQTKTASEKAAPTQATEEDTVIQKVAAQLTSEDVAELEKIAEEAETEKTAEEAQTYGRLMARGFYEELNKLAADGEVGLTGTMNAERPAVGNRTIASGGDTSPGAIGSKGGPQQTNAATPQDGSTVLKKIQQSIESIHRPASPTAKEDAMKVVRKIIDAARPVRQQAAEVPHNG